MTRTRLAYSSVLALFLAVPFRSEAQTIAIDSTQAPATVDQLGYATGYIATPPNNGYTPQTVTWSYQQTDCATTTAAGLPAPATSPWVTVSGSIIPFPIPGTFTVKVVFSYPKVSDPNLDPNPPAPTMATKTVTIQPPALDHIEGDKRATPLSDSPPPDPGLITPTSLGGVPGDWVYFVLKSNGKTIGQLVEGFTVQEMFTKFVVIVTPQGDTPWRPLNPNAASPRDQGPDSSFTFGLVPDGNDFAVRDFKTANCADPTYNKQIATYFQQNRIFWNDSNGNPVTPVPIGSQQWTITGNGDGTWTGTYQ